MVRDRLVATPKASDHLNGTVGSEQAIPPAQPRPPRVEQVAFQRLTVDCPFAFYFRDITMWFADGRLILRGRVPTFYLKQILQSRLQGLDGVEQIDDRVEVVSSTGLSSTRS